MLVPAVYISVSKQPINPFLGNEIGIKYLEQVNVANHVSVLILPIEQDKT